jgi:hypothetical protein
VSLTTAEAREAIYQHWKTQWDTLRPGALYYFENENVAPEPTTTWARVTVRHTDSAQHTLGVAGARQFRREAAIWVQLFVPLDQGMAALDALVSDVRTVFEGVNVDDIDPAGAARVQEVGPDGKWYEVVVVAPVTYYETR